MSLLERMRNKPSHVKNQYAFFTALSVTLAIAIVWAISLPARFSQHPQVSDTSASDSSSSLTNLIDEAQLQLGNAVSGASTGQSDQTAPTQTWPTTAPAQEQTVASDTTATPSVGDAQKETNTSEPAAAPAKETPSTPSKDQVVLIATSSENGAKGSD